VPVLPDEPSADLSNQPAVETPATASSEPVNVALEHAAGGATFIKPVQVVPYGNRLHVVEQEGRVVAVDEKAGGAPWTMLDLSARVFYSDEMGLLSMAFHPRHEENGHVFVYYVAPPPAAEENAFAVSILSRFNVVTRGDVPTLDPSSEKIILTINQPGNAHKGGTLAFGNDGYLYWSLGDGAYGSDPFHNAQDVNSLLGSVLRLDVDNGDPYAIPETNPYAAPEVPGRPELFAKGLRNPYRFSFDRETGDLWLGDVGEEAFEEIQKVTLGGNYGWPIREGTICYRATSCLTEGLIDPLVEHPRDQAKAITGGVVYRGTRIPALTGKYVYGDFITKKLFALSLGGGDSVENNKPVTVSATPASSAARAMPTSFALDDDGEIVMSSFDGRILRLVAPPQ